MTIIQKIARNKALGILTLLFIFFVFVSAWFILPKAYTRIVRYQKELSRATVPVSLSLEEKKKIEKEILEGENAIRSSDKKGADTYAGQYVSLGEKFESLGYRAKAVKAYQNALREDGKNVSAYTHLGGIFQRMKDYISSRDAFRAAIDLNPPDATLYPKLARVYLEGMKDFETARGVFLEGLVRANNDIRLIKEYVPFLESIGEYSEAALYKQEILKKEQKK